MDRLGILIAPSLGLINLQYVALEVADKCHPTVRHFQDFVNDPNAPSPEGLDQVVNSRLNLKARHKADSAPWQVRRLAVAMEHQRRARGGELKIGPGDAAERFKAEHVTVVVDRAIQVFDVDEQPARVEQKWRRLWFHRRPAQGKSSSTVKRRRRRPSP